MRWLSDDQKDRANRRDHGLSFETAQLVFDDPLAVSRVDPYPLGDRWQTVRLVGAVVLFVVHTWPEPDLVTAAATGRINTAVLPQQTDWSGARRGVFYRPIKKQLTLRLDADLIDWFKGDAPGGGGYQTRINQALREYVARWDLVR